MMPGSILIQSNSNSDLTDLTNCLPDPNKYKDQPDGYDYIKNILNKGNSL